MRELHNWQCSSNFVPSLLQNRSWLPTGTALAHLGQIRYATNSLTITFLLMFKWSRAVKTPLETPKLNLARQPPPSTAQTKLARISLEFRH